MALKTCIVVRHLTPGPDHGTVTETEGKRPTEKMKVSMSGFFLISDFNFFLNIK